MEFILHMLLVGAVFAVVDAIWIGVVANKFYKAQLGDLMAPKPDFAPAVIFYVIYVAAIVYLALQPALASNSLGEVFMRSLVFGLAAYATYDLTNASTIKNWPKPMTIVDLLWGTTATTVSTVVAFIILR